LSSAREVQQLTDPITVHGEGPVWFEETGELRLVDIGVPATQVTACTFGGPQLDQLFITTSRLGRSPDDEPLAGAVFAFAPGVAELPARPCGG
jgi:sugar lactone lactonase YvrE